MCLCVVVAAIINAFPTRSKRDEVLDVTYLLCAPSSATWTMFSRLVSSGTAVYYCLLGRRELALSLDDSNSYHYVHEPRTTTTTTTSSGDFSTLALTSVKIPCRITSELQDAFLYVAGDARGRCLRDASFSHLASRRWVATLDMDVSQHHMRLTISTNRLPSTIPHGSTLVLVFITVVDVSRLWTLDNTLLLNGPLDAMRLVAGLWSGGMYCGWNPLAVRTALKSTLVDDGFPYSLPSAVDPLYDVDWQYRLYWAYHIHTVFRVHKDTTLLNASSQRWSHSDSPWTDHDPDMEDTHSLRDMTTPGPSVPS
ncbi:hypothetical protein BDZ89DRAFT_1044396 [Hymenopellis radicata]|nr:hypothetical protein BDZ89DRAFT_1044396 [Hymenopellis radicata]